MIVKVNLPINAYEIKIERGVLSKAGEELNLNRKVMIVTDDGVPSKYSEVLSAQCLNASIFVLKHGEESKNLDNFAAIEKALLENGFSRKDCVVALGGGVVGDLAGFAASCFMRGIDFYNIPTTVLSQVDSSVGGKTAVDFNGVKNGNTYLDCKDSTARSSISTIEGLIPSGASTSNKLATASDLANKVNTSVVGANNGVASLDSTGKVPSSQLPSYVDDVLEYADRTSFPSTAAYPPICTDRSAQKLSGRGRSAERAASSTSSQVLTARRAAWRS